jgi:hypothetical protein
VALLIQRNSFCYNNWVLWICWKFASSCIAQEIATWIILLFTDIYVIILSIYVNNILIITCQLERGHIFLCMYLSVKVYLQNKTRRHITNVSPVKWMKEDSDIIMGGQPAYCKVFTSSSELAGIWLLVRDMACPFLPKSAHVADSTGVSVDSKPTSRQNSFQMPLPPNSVAENDQQTLNLKHLSEAITTLTSPPVSYSWGNVIITYIVGYDCVFWKYCL